MSDCVMCSFFVWIGSFFMWLLGSVCANPWFLVLFSVLVGVLVVGNVHAAITLCRCDGRPNILDAANGRGDHNERQIRDAFDYSIVRGPHTWSTNEQNQSPINIWERDVKRLPMRELLTWNHYEDLPCGITLLNNGHTIIVRATYAGNRPTVSGADLFASYTFVELCFRWSQVDTEGSEHMLNFKKFPLELQAMHRTGPCRDTTSSYDVLMIAYFYEISSINPYLTPIVQNLYRVREAGTEVQIPPFPLIYLCHPFRNNFLSYGGSLTEPPCYQGTEWFIYTEPLAISKEQLQEFRKICGPDGMRIQRNFRPVQRTTPTRIISRNEYNPMAACSQPAMTEDEDGEGVESSRL